MKSWTSYPKVYAIGHRNIKEIFNEPVLIQEKIDGSQISFGMFTQEGILEPVLRVRSKGAEINVDYPEKMFSAGVAAIKELAPKLYLNWTYRGEYLASPSHNVLKYDRTPKRHIILFDIAIGQEEYLANDLVHQEAERLDLEVVATLGEGVSVSEPQTLLNLLDKTSVLGGQKIEGFVCKNYKRFDLTGKPLFGKYVSEAFKESHAKEWGAANPNQGGILDLLIAKYKTDARWAKAVIHCKEAGTILGEPRDIPTLLKEIHQDFDSECEAEVKDQLYKWAASHIKRGIIAGMPQWYKERLMKESFTKEVTKNEELPVT